MFAGYDPFKALRLASLYDRIVPAPVHRGLRRLADLLPISPRNMALDFKLRRSLTGLSYGEALWNPVWLGPLEPAAIAELFEERVAPEELFAEALALWRESPPGASLVDRTLEFYTNFYLQDDILTKVDRAAMMVSLESRAVFLDNDLVDFCQRLPHRFKYRNGERKYLLKKALAGLLPAELLKRPKKGFGIPLAAWLKTVPAVPPLAPVDGARIDWVSGRWREHRAGQRDHRLFLWSWLSLQSLLPGAAAAPLRGAA
jgi:asparagine synthase (glutamine-hydrolysing)